MTEKPPTEDWPQILSAVKAWLAGENDEQFRARLERINPQNPVDQKVVEALVEQLDLRECEQEALDELERAAEEIRSRTCILDDGEGEA